MIFLFQNHFCTLAGLIIPSKSHIAEAELVARLKAKDKAALGYLYDHYSGALYGVIARIVIHEGIAQEILQDVFLKFWNKIDTYDASKGRLFTWMLNISRNQAIDKTRSKEISKDKKTTDIQDSVSRVDLKSFQEQSVDAIGLKEVLMELPPEQKFVVEHLYFKGYSQSELAEEFNIPLGTVKTRLRLAMQHLRVTLKTVEY